MILLPFETPHFNVGVHFYKSSQVIINQLRCESRMIGSHTGVLYCLILTDTLETPPPSPFLTLVIFSSPLNFP